VPAYRLIVPSEVIFSMTPIGYSARNTFPSASETIAVGLISGELVAGPATIPPEVRR